MLLSYKWLSEFVELADDIEIKDIAEHLTMSGLEVESLEPMGQGLVGMKIAQVLAFEAHPTKPDLRVCQIDVGGHTETVVCGAKNFNAFDWVVFAPVGSTLLNGMHIAKRKVGGIESSGMLASEKELGLSDDHSGIMLVPHDVGELKAGADARVTLGLDDYLLEIKITPNRADALSHFGVARELSAVLQTRSYFPNSSLKELGAPIHDVAQVTIADKDACPRYACRVIEGVQIAPSPFWLRKRLAACGIRPINNVVDATNWVLLERGQPMHAFDFDALSKDRGRTMITVRPATAGEKLVTLDGKERTLSEKDLVIADAEKVLALAGIMGGQSSEVNNATTTVLLESAYFEPSGIRHSARRQGLSTEGSYRFERGADPGSVVIALDRATELIVQLAGGKVRREAIDIYPRPILPLEISVRRQKLAEISGLPEAELDEGKIRSRFLLLGIETVSRRSGDALSFRVPTFRPDLTREIDLIEEAMRLIGFDKVPIRISFTKRVTGGLQDHKLEHIENTARRTLTASGFYEAVNFSFGSPSRFKLFAAPHDPEPIRVANPLGEELSVMRQTLVPGLLENALFNARRGSKSVHLFEIGTVFMGPSEQGKVPNTQILSGTANQDSWADERIHLGTLMFGVHGLHAFDVKKTSVDFYDLKGVLEEFFAGLMLSNDHVSSQMHFEKPHAPPVFMHPGMVANVIFKRDSKSKNVVIGFIGQIHPDVQKAYELDEPAYVFELDLRMLKELAQEYRIMKPIAKFPSVQRDLALLLSDDVMAGDLIDTIVAQDALSELLADIEIFDVYRGDKIPAGKKSLAISLTLRAQERTLTDDEVAGLMEPLVKNLHDKLGAVIR